MKPLEQKEEQVESTSGATCFLLPCSKISLHFNNKSSNETLKWNCNFSYRFVRFLSSLEKEKSARQKIQEISNYFALHEPTTCLSLQLVPSIHRSSPRHLFLSHFLFNFVIYFLYDRSIPFATRIRAATVRKLNRKRNRNRGRRGKGEGRQISCRYTCTISTKSRYRYDIRPNFLRGKTDETGRVLIVTGAAGSSGYFRSSHCFRVYTEEPRHHHRLAGWPCNQPVIRQMFAATRKLDIRCVFPRRQLFSAARCSKPSLPSPPLCEYFCSRSGNTKRPDAVPFDVFAEFRRYAGPEF